MCVCLCSGGYLYVRAHDWVACFTAVNSSDVQQKSLLGLCTDAMRKQQLEDEASEADESAAAKKTNKNKNRRGRGVRAVLSHSTARVRKDLHELGIGFRTPFDSYAMQREAGDFSVMDELAALGKSERARVAFPSKQQLSGHDSLLMFDGHHQVHGLYDFLLNRKRTGRGFLTW